VPDQPASPNEEASSVSSAGSSTSPYTAGPGPGFDPNRPPPAAPAGEEPAGLGAFAEAWEEDQVRDWLRNAGALAHAGFGVGEHDWEMTQADLERIAPPATRILNRYQPTRLVAAYSDPAAVAVGFGLYGWRSTLERMAVLAEQQPEEPDTSQAPGHAEPGNGHPQTYAARLRATRPQED
jgi:hypothetical protein